MLTNRLCPKCHTYNVHAAHYPNSIELYCLACGWQEDMK